MTCISLSPSLSFSLIFLSLALPPLLSLSQFLPHLLSFWLWIKRDCKWYAVGWPPDCHIWLRNVSVHVSHVCLFLASLFAVTFTHAQGTQWLHGSQTVCHEQQTCANQTHSSGFPFSFSQPLFSFFAFSRFGGVLYQLWDTPTREKSQEIKEHWERQVEQNKRTGTSDGDMCSFLRTEIRADRGQFHISVS